MKKVYLMLSSMLAVGLLAACSGGETGRDYVIEEGNSVVTDEVKQANYNQNKKYGVKTYQKLEYELPTGYSLVNQDLNKGYLVLSKAGKYGVYSIYGNKFVIDGLATEPSSFSSDPVAGYTFVYQPTTTRYVLADGAGNKLYESDKAFYANVSYRTGEDFGVKSLYSEVSITKYDLVALTASYEKQYYKYNESTLVASSVEIPLIYASNYHKAGDEYHGYTKFSLEPYGLSRIVSIYGDAQTTGYVIKLNDLTGKEEASFELNKGYQLVGYFGCGMVFEHRNETYVGSNRVRGASNYKVEHKRIDFKSLKMTTLDIPAEITSINMLKPFDKDSEKYLATVELTEVRSDGSIGNNRVMIVDQDFKFHDDITFKNFVSWKRLHNGYFYDSATGVVYNDKFEPVFNAAGLSFDDEAEVFYSSYTGIINLEGKEVYDDKFINIDLMNQGVYSATNSQPQKMSEMTAYLKTSDASVFYLQNETVDEKVISETLVPNSSNLLLQRVEYPTSDPTSRKGVLKTIDGQTLITVEDKFGTGFDYGELFSQSETYIDLEYRHSFAGVEYEVDSATKIALIYTSLLPVTTIA